MFQFLLIPNNPITKSILCSLCFVLGNAGLSEAESSRSCSPVDFDAIAESLELESGDWLADIGAGRARYLGLFAEYVGKQGHIFAVDINPEPFDDLHEQMAGWDYFNITPVYSVEKDPLLPSASFEAIMMRNAYHEFSNPDEMLRHFKASLKEGGKLAIIDFMDEEIADSDRETQEENHRLDMAYAKDDLKEAGFEVTIAEPEFARFPNNDTVTNWMLIAKPADR